MKLHQAAALAISATLLAGAAQAAPAARTRGTVEQVSDSSITLKTRAGATATMALTPQTKVVAITSAKIEDIKPDSYIGSAAMPQPDGTLKAFDVQVFAPAMRGSGEGTYPWDKAPGSSMTNGVVGGLVGTSGRTMTVNYKGGQKTIVVPPNVPIVAMAPGERSLLKPGAHVIVFANPAGTAAGAVGVGVGGVVPPM